MGGCLRRLCTPPHRSKHPSYAPLSHAPAPTTHCDTAPSAHGDHLLSAFNGQGVTLVGEGGELSEQTVRTPSHAEDNVELTWDTSDCFMVPSWRWQQHRNDSDEPAWIFSVTDAPALK